MGEFLLGHFEKVALIGFAGFFAVAAGAPLWARAHATDDVPALEAKIAAIDAFQKTCRPAVEGVPDSAEALRARLEPSRVGPAEPLPPWLAHRRPSIAYSIYEPPAPPASRHDAPAIALGSVGHGKIGLTWKPAGTNVCDIAGYELLRGPTSGGPWEKVASLGPDASQHVDATVKPRQRFFYRVVETATPQPGHQPLEPGQVALDAVTTSAQEVPPDAALALSGGEPAPKDASAKGWVGLRVYRWDESLGKWQSKTYPRVEEGQTIGGPGKVRVGSRDVPFDFRVDAEIVPDSIRRNEKNVLTCRIRWSDGFEEEIADRVIPPAVR